jgi:DNA-binding MarR family transcriptional regulator
VLFLDALENDGWVRRLPHPGDRRAHNIALTDEGAKRFEEVGLALYRQQQDNLSALSAAEQTQLIDLLTRLHADLAARHPGAR